MNRVLAPLVLVCCLSALAACSRAQREKAAQDARDAVNTYCDKRQVLLDSLNAPDAGAKP